MNVRADFPSFWILESDTDIRSVIAVIAEFEGFRVKQLSLLSEAKRVHDEIVGNRQAPHVILSDLYLPDGCSDEFMALCRSSFPEIPIFCASFSVEPEIADKFREIRIQMIRKPFSLQTVLRVLSKSEECF